jgi:hypothetical protein
LSRYLKDLRLAPGVFLFGKTEKGDGTGFWRSLVQVYQRCRSSFTGSWDR